MPASSGHIRGTPHLEVLGGPRNPSGSPALPQPRFDWSGIRDHASDLQLNALLSALLVSDQGSGALL